jgi:hypothetical protein
VKTTASDDRSGPNMHVPGGDRPKEKKFHHSNEKSSEIDQEFESSTGKIESDYLDKRVGIKRF